MWEGDPGFQQGSRWRPGVETYLDAPLEELIEKRNRRELGAWRTEWKEQALPAMHEADMIGALGSLRTGLELDPNGDPDVFEAHNRIATLKDAVTNFDTTIQLVAKDKCDAALEVLLDWGEYFGAELDKRTRKKLKPAIRSEETQAWEALFAHLKSHSRRMKKDGDEEARDELIAYLGSLEGRFPEMVLDWLDGVPADQIPKALDDVERIPALWLAQEFFRW